MHKSEKMEHTEVKYKSSSGEVNAAKGLASLLLLSLYYTYVRTIDIKKYGIRGIEE